MAGMSSKGGASPSRPGAWKAWSGCCSPSACDSSRNDSAEPPMAWTRNSGGRSPRGCSVASGDDGPAAGASRSTVARDSTVAFPKSRLSGSFLPSRRSICATSRTVRSECPPSAKKSSRTPTDRRPSTSAKMEASSIPVRSLGASAASPSWPRDHSGSGRALRSILPLGLRGMACNTTRAEGTMKRGRCCLSNSCSSPASTCWPAFTDTYPTSFLSAPSPLATTTASCTPGCRRSPPPPLPARFGSRAPSPGSRFGPGTPARRPPSTSPGLPSGTSSLRAPR